MCDVGTDLSRRRFVGIASRATSALAFTVGALFANEQNAILRETADLITGPFYPRVKPRDRDADLTLVRGHRQRAAGQVVQMSGRVTQLFFPDERLNDQDRHLNSVRRPETLIANISSSIGSELVAHWDIVLTRG